MIAAGLVKIDGRIAKLGDSVDPAVNSVTVNGKRVELRAGDRQTLAFNKPLGVVTTMRDERGRPAVAQFLPAGRRLVPIGRLDADSTGLLLCTNDGELHRILSHPSFGVSKRYHVTVKGEVTPKTVKQLSAENVTRAKNGTYVFDLILREGKNRQVRRMCAAQGLRVLSLLRTGFGPVRLGKLRPGQLRPLTKAELDELEYIRRQAKWSLSRARE